MTRITPDELRVIIKYIYDVSGIHLDENKGYLVETRLGRLIKEFGCASYGELCFKAKSDVTGAIRRKVIDAISTKETLFFRDKTPFELLQNKILPDLIDKRASQSSGILPINIRIWSAACATGQEIFSIGMVLKEIVPDLSKYNVRLLGTDISDEAVSRASYGQYGKFEIERGLPEDKLERYFNSDGNVWRIKDEVRSLAVFKRHSLMDSFAGLGKFDIVFCRNVAIYFAHKDRVNLFYRIADILEPDGYLIIGSTESLMDICPRFEPEKYLRSIFYRLAA